MLKKPGETSWLTPDWSRCDLTPSIAAAQTPHDVIGGRGSLSGHFEEVETCHPSLFTVHGCEAETFPGLNNVLLSRLMFLIESDNKAWAAWSRNINQS